MFVFPGLASAPVCLTYRFSLSFSACIGPEPDLSREAYLNTHLFLFSMLIPLLWRREGGSNAASLLHLLIIDFSSIHLSRAHWNAGKVRM